MISADLSNGSVLAYIGDAIMTLKVRECLVALGYTKPKDLQEKSAVYISATAQAEIMTIILESDFLNEKERQIYLLGRNYKGHSKAKNATVQDYKIASGFEAIWGYHYLTNNTERLDQIWNKTRTIVEESS